jgi:hypothetical protein
MLPERIFTSEKALTKNKNPGSMGTMKTKTSLLTLAICFAAGTVCFASPMMGTWKLNEAKSKFAPGTSKNTMVVYKEAMGGKVKITTGGVDANGKPTHGEWTGKFDGKDYPVTGDPTADTRSYTKVDDRTLDFNVKKGGKVTVTGRVVAAADGKSRTVTTSGTSAKGKKFKNVAVFDKQ